MEEKEMPKHKEYKKGYHKMPQTGHMMKDSEMMMGKKKMGSTKKGKKYNKAKRASRGRGRGGRKRFLA